MTEATVGVVTTVKIDKTYDWVIERSDCVQSYKMKKPIYSPIFSTTCPNGNILNWRLKFYHDRGEIWPNPIIRWGRFPTEENQGNYVCFYLQSMNKFEVSTMLSISMASNLSSAVVEKKTYCPAYFHVYKAAWGWNFFVGRNELYQSHSATKTFALRCSIYSTKFDPTVVPLNTAEVAVQAFTEDKCITTAEVAVQTVKEDDSFIATDHFEKVFETGDLSDVTFSIGDQSLKLHKVILGSTSPVFHSMFNGENDEAKNIRQVTITTEDASYEVMKEMFRYIYARKVNNMEAIAIDLFVAAEKYQIEGLKTLCDKTLCSDLNTDNAMPRLELAVKYHMIELESKVTDFVSTKLKFYLKKEQYGQLSSVCRDIILNLVANKLEDDL